MMSRGQTRGLKLDSGANCFFCRDSWSSRPLAVLQDMRIVSHCLEHQLVDILPSSNTENPLVQENQFN